MGTKGGFFSHCFRYNTLSSHIFNYIVFLEVKPRSQCLMYVIIHLKYITKGPGYVSGPMSLTVNSVYLREVMACVSTAMFAGLCERVQESDSQQKQNMLPQLQQRIARTQTALDNCTSARHAAHNWYLKINNIL